MAKKYPGHSSEPGTECATPAACPLCHGVWCNGTMQSLAQVTNETEATKEVYPLEKDNETEKTWPMTDSASGYCAYPSERSDPELGSEKLGAAPTSPEEILKVCQMAEKYQGHRAVPGTECATPTTCGGCNGVWCNGTVKSLLQTKVQAANETEATKEVYPLEKDNETEKTWPMTDSASGYCAYPSERSDPELGSEKLGAAPTSPEEILKVCQMAEKYQGHRAVPGTECATPTTCGGCNGVWCNGTVKSLLQTKVQAANETEATREVYPLEKDNETEKTWPMTDSASGYCAYPSERSDPELGSEKLGAAPTSPEEILKVCQMAEKYQGHRAVPGTECATPTTCGGCNGVWCNGTVKSLLQTKVQAANETEATKEVYPLEKDNETEKTWPMTDSASGYCAYPSERSDPELGSEKLGAAPTSPEEILKVCQMAEKYQGHRAVPGTECATPTTCGGCNGVWCNGTVKSLLQTKVQAANETEATKEVYPLEKDNETEKTWPMTDSASGYCAYPSERSDPELGSEKLGAAPTSPEEILKVCQMAEKYQGHRAVPGTECATPTTCGGCNGVWCNGTVMS